MAPSSEPATKRSPSKKRRLPTTDADFPLPEIPMTADGAGRGKKGARRTLETGKQPEGMHSSRQAQAASAPKKRQRAKKEPKQDASPPPERRATKFRPTASLAVQQRIERAFQHRLYLIGMDVQSEDDTSPPSSSHFHVLGSTGNVYKVTVAQRPACTCPDFSRHRQACKHLLFVFLRVLRLRRDDARAWQPSLLPSEVADLMRAAASLEGAAVSDVLAGAAVRRAFEQADSTAGGGVGAEAPPAAAVAGAGVRGEALPAAAAAGEAVKEEASQGAKQRPLDGDCPICYEPLGQLDAAAGVVRATEAVAFCACCGNSVHAECFGRWEQARRGSGAAVSCVWCRAPWVEGGGAEAGDGSDRVSGRRGRGGRGRGRGRGGGSRGGGGVAAAYMNLAQFSEGHRGGGVSLQERYPETYQFIHE